MRVKIDKQYAIAASIGTAWEVLRDIRQVAGCMPGAEITEQVDPTHYKGVMKIRVGPASAAFAGELEVLEIDAENKRVRFKGKGAERSGSTAAMDLTATLHAGEDAGDSAGACILQGNAEVTVSGKFAQFGARMMNSVADTMLERFTQSFSQKAAALAAPVASSEMQAGAAVATPATELNALSLVWDAIKRFFAGLLRTRK